MRAMVRGLANMVLLALPILAATALYLPGGMRSPVRWAALFLAALALLSWRHSRQQLGRAALIATPGLIILVSGLVPVLIGEKPIGWNEFISFAAAVAASGVAAMVSRQTRSTNPDSSTPVRAIAWGWLIAGMLCAGVVAWEVATGKHLSRYLAGQVYPKRYPGWNIPAAFMNNPNLLAYLGVVVLSVAPLAFVATRRSWLRAVVAIIGVLDLAMIWQTESKIGVASAAIVLMSWAFAWRRVRYPAIILGSIAFYLVWFYRLTGTAALRYKMQELVWNIEKPGDSGWIRWRLIRSGIWMLEDTHGLGTGPGSFSNRVLASPYRPKDIMNPHSALVEIGSQYGIVALAGWLIGLVVIAIWAMRTVRFRDAARWSLPATIRRTLIATALAWPLLSMTHSTWMDQPITLAHLATLGVLVGALARPRCDADRADPEPGNSTKRQQPTDDDDIPVVTGTVLE